MKMCGVTRLDQLHPGYLNTLAVEHLIPKMEEQNPLNPHIKSRL